jgi:pimeloyl-ACP methyl ester carboxylesterase
MSRPVLSLLGALATTALVACGASTSTNPRAACAASGPALQASAADMQAAIGGPDKPSSAFDPVLLIHGTGSTSEESWASTYVPALTAAGFDVYTVDLPGKAYVDIQDSSEYVVYAVRWIAARHGRRVDVIGHSQGGLEPRWAAQWWPDVRDDIDDLVTLATPHHGTVVSDAYCDAGCKPAHWQMKRAARFVAALNEGAETWPQVSTTSLFSRNDELVQPQEPESTAALAGASNIAIQDLCPGHPVDHVGMMRDGAVYALVMDALTHDGPADPARFDPLACAQFTIPGVGPAESLQGNYYFVTSGNSDVPDATEEPPVKSYGCS